jgi:hypothetical protein
LRFTGWTALIGVLLLPLAVIFLKLRFSMSVILLIASLLMLSLFAIHKTNAVKLRSIPLIMALFMGLSFLVYTYIDIQYASKQDNYPRKIAQEIDLLIPDNIGTVYEVGYDRFLEITCYLKKQIIQLDKFSDLKALEKKGNIYFIFDTGLLEKGTNEEEKIFLREMTWKKIYSKYYTKSKGEIVVGHLR